MRLIAFKPSYATDEHRKKGVTVDGWRWAIHTGAWKNGISLDLIHEIKHDKIKDNEEEEWDPHHGEYFTVSITRFFRLGSIHNYYDGPNCGFSIGFLHFSWSYWWCKKCMKDGSEEG
jgi:hypothetical protein